MGLGFWVLGLPSKSPKLSNANTPEEPKLPNPGVSHGLSQSILQGGWYKGEGLGFTGILEKPQGMQRGGGKL